jgi:decaprenylphospho-beta-D-ribofuranose 2-oxidase
VLADGRRVSVTPDSDPELWSATLGGMGLTGLITDATFRLIAIETSRVLVETERLPHLDALIERMERSDRDHRYSVAWIDLVAGGSHLGRSVLQQGRHATVADLQRLAPAALGAPLAYGPRAAISVPPTPNVMSRIAVRAFNEMWYRKAPRHRIGIESIAGFFHPLDAVGNWNRFYGAQGFVQYQFVVPLESVDVLRAVIERVSSTGFASAVSVLKRFGPESGGLLSFPRPGWTLTFDVPAAAPGLGSLLGTLDEMVIAAGGRHYLAKDACTTPEVVAAGYPRLAEWKSIRRRVDPDGVWASDQARRLDLL